MENHTWFIGEPENIYEFRMRGIDQAGNTENYPTSAEVTSVIPDADELCARPDNWEVDNDPATANRISTNDHEITHNLCNPLTPNHLDDEDWKKISVQAGRTYNITTTPLSGSPASLTITILADNGITELASASAEHLGEPTQLTWTADRNSLVYIQMKHIDGNVIGEDVAYTIAIQDLVYYMPSIYRNHTNFSAFENFFPGVNIE
jgi:hypothetical protein